MEPSTSHHAILGFIILMGTFVSDPGHTKTSTHTLTYRCVDEGVWMFLSNSRWGHSCREDKHHFPFARLQRDTAFFLEDYKGFIVRKTKVKDTCHGYALYTWIKLSHHRIIQRTAVVSCNWTATDALTKEVPGGIHLFASCGGMGLEFMCVCGALYCPTGADGTSSVDAAETAQKLCG